MDIKKSVVALGLLGIIGCDPEREITFEIENRTDNNINVYLFGSGFSNRQDTLTIPPGSEELFLSYTPIGGGFSAISTYDSVYMEIDTEEIRWYRPDNSYGYIDTDNSIGQDRNMPKDFYNTKDWESTLSEEEEDWIFYLDEEDVNSLLEE